MYPMAWIVRLMVVLETVSAFFTLDRISVDEMKGLIFTFRQISRVVRLSSFLGRPLLLLGSILLVVFDNLPSSLQTADGETLSCLAISILAIPVFLVP